jgi:hypothetical protein
MYKLQINSLCVHEPTSEQKILNDISELKEYIPGSNYNVQNSKEYLGMNIKIYDEEVCRIFFGNRYMTDKEYIETNFPRNKKIVIEYIGDIEKQIVAIKIYSHGHIKCIFSGDFLPPYIKTSVDNYDRRLKSFPKNFNRVYFLGEEIKDFSPIRKFYEGKNPNQREKLLLWEGESGDLNISLLYGKVFEAVIFMDDDQNSDNENFSVCIRNVQYHADRNGNYLCARLGGTQRGNHYIIYKSVIFRGNKKIEVVGLKYHHKKFTHDPRLDLLLK